MSHFLNWLGDASVIRLDGVVRATVLLASAGLVAALLRSKTAAARHLVWTVAIVGVLALPLVSGVLPPWNVLPSDMGQAAVFPMPDESLAHSISTDVASPSQLVASPVSSDESHEATSQEVGASDSAEARDAAVASFSATPIRVRDMLAGAWLLGVIMALLPVSLGAFCLRRRRRQAVPMSDELRWELCNVSDELSIRRPVAGLLSSDTTMPLTWGWLRPIVMLPSDAETWTRERRRLVLLHELAHVRRGDCVIQLTAQVVRALHWFNPLAWLALSRIRDEQERACDDVVLNAGESATEYAAELLSITSKRPRAIWDAAVALAMNRTTRLESRLSAILDERRERRPLTAAHRAALVSACSAIAITIAVLSHDNAQADGLAAASAASATQPADPFSSGSPILLAQANNDSDDNKAAAQAPAKEAATPKTLELADVIELITKHGLAKVDAQSLNEAAIRGMLESLKDPYSSLITTDQMKEFSQTLSGNLVGIGAMLAREKDEIVVTGTIPNSPAMQGGLKAHDVIIDIDGKPAKDLVESVKQIRGAAGTKLSLKVRRGDKTEALSLTRGEVRVPSIRGVSLDDKGQWLHWLNANEKIGYVTIHAFDASTETDLKSALTRLREQGLKGLVLDLRGSPGGMFQELVKVAQVFLKDANVVEIRGQAGGTPNTLKTTADAPFADVPLIVVVDPRTASAAEVLTAALKDNRRAVIVGERTFGKGSVQQIVPLSEGGPALKLTTAEMVSPSGQALNRTPDAKTWGVDPDDGYFVPLTAAERMQRLQTRQAAEAGTLKLDQPVTTDVALKQLHDPQLAAAIKSLSDKLSTGEFTKSGRPLSDQQTQLAQLNEVRKQRDELRKRLEQLDRELGEGR